VPRLTLTKRDYHANGLTKVFNASVARITRINSPTLNVGCDIRAQGRSIIKQIPHGLSEISRPTVNVNNCFRGSKREYVQHFLLRLKELIGPARPRPIGGNCYGKHHSFIASLMAEITTHLNTKPCFQGEGEFVRHCCGSETLRATAEAPPLAQFAPAHHSLCRSTVVVRCCGPYQGTL
jgi:hypothetical protein